MTSPLAPLPIVILLSGRGSNMLAIARAVGAGQIHARVAAVISDRADAAGLVKAQELGISTQVLSPRDYADRTAYDAALAKLVQSHSPGLVVLAGFMRILSPAFVHAFAGRLFNIHPSLLPAYRGLHTHGRVLQAGERWHGCSVHFVTEELDGGPLIVQARVPVEARDTPETLLARVQVQEHRIYPLAVDWFARGRLRWQDNQPWLDGRPLLQPVVMEAE